MPKFKIHSAVDVITNSSTVIYTWSGSCLEPAKEMINEFTKMMGYSETADDMFWFGVFCDPDDCYSWVKRQLENEDESGDDCDNIPKELKNLTYETYEQYFNDLFNKILSKEILEPKWMTQIEESENWMGFPPGTTLHILSKDKKYTQLAEKISKFLYSTENDGGRDG